MTTAPTDPPASPERRPLHLFDAIGVELEYMIVDAETLAVRPIADFLLRRIGALAGAPTGEVESEIELGAVAWSNELALHVAEIKTNGPVATLAGLGDLFHRHLLRAGELLAPIGARLMPGAMHPFMDPEGELRLWPHEYDVVYRTFHRIFDCRGHGWANVQSVHVNLPFHGDREFGRLHTAIRAALPILPALAASSPLADGRVTGLHDTRMDAYGRHAARVPSVVGAIVPEAIATRRDYEREVLGRIYADLAPLDPEGILRHEWVNARGAIARFDRGAIEVRVLDVQECPGADVAVAGAVVEVVRALVEERFATQAAQHAFATPALAAVLRDTVTAGDRAVIHDAAYLRLLGFPEPPPCRARDLWQHLFETTVEQAQGWSEWEPALSLYAAEGCLARRLLRALGPRPQRQEIEAVYRRLCDCLDRNETFRP